MTISAREALAAATFAILLQAFLLLSFDGQAWTLVWQAALMSVVVLSTAFLGDELGRFDLRQPWCVLLIFHLPFWVLGSFRVVLDETLQAAWIPGARALVPQAMCVVSVGFLLIALGYRVGVSRRVRVPRGLVRLHPWSEARLTWTVAVAYGLAWLTRLSWYRLALDLPFTDLIARGGASSWARTFGTTVPLFLILATWSAYYASGTKRRLALAIAVTAGELIWGLVYAVMKSLIFLPLFLPIVPYVVQKGRVPLTRTVVAGLTLILLIYPYVDAVRGVYFQVGGPSRTEAIRDVVSSDVPLLSFGRERLLQIAERATSRVTGLGSITQILQLDAERALDIRGEFYVRAVLGLVPRFLWPGKPVIHEGSYLTAVLEGQHDLDSIDLASVYGSTAPTLFGSFFWNLGWPALVLSSLVLGVFSGTVYRTLKIAGLDHPTVFLYYSAVLTVCDTTETEVAKFPSTLMWGLLLAWAASRLLGSRRGVVAVTASRRLAGHPRPVVATAPPRE